MSKNPGITLDQSVTYHTTEDIPNNQDTIFSKSCIKTKTNRSINSFNRKSSTKKNWNWNSPVKISAPSRSRNMQEKQQILKRMLIFLSNFFIKRRTRPALNNSFALPKVIFSKTSIHLHTKKNENQNQNQTNTNPKAQNIVD